MRATKIKALRSAVTDSAVLPISPLVEIIVEYALEDVEVTQLIGEFNKFPVPSAIALVSRYHPTSDKKDAAVEADEILIAGGGDAQKLRLYSIPATGNRTEHTRAINMSCQCPVAIQERAEDFFFVSYLFLPYRLCAHA
jgi:hypothetical protein